MKVEMGNVVFWSCIVVFVLLILLAGYVSQEAIDKNNNFCKGRGYYGYSNFEELKEYARITCFNELTETVISVKWSEYK